MSSGAAVFVLGPAGSGKVKKGETWHYFILFLFVVNFLPIFIGTL